MIFRLKNNIIDFGAKFDNNYKYEPKNHPLWIIKMGHVSEASAAHPYQKNKQTKKKTKKKTKKNKNKKKKTGKLPPLPGLCDCYSNNQVVF